jgi:DNA-binding transcriptional ArsR family regulator
MLNYSIKNIEKLYFLQFFHKENIGTEWIELGLPTPHYLQHTQTGYFIAWALDGYFYTTKAKTFLLDVVARYLHAFPDAEKLNYRPYIEDRENNAHTIDREPYKLKDIAKHLPSLPHESGELTNVIKLVAKENSRLDDRVFEASRWHLYRYAYAYGTDAITYDYVLTILETENELLGHPKTLNELKSKAKRMTEYMHNEFIVYETTGYKQWDKQKRAEYMRKYREDKELVKMTRSEAALKASSVKADRAKKAIVELTTSLIANDYKTKTGKWNISKIARDLKMSRDTVRKHLKELEL